jgi:hypothetical protein
LAGLLLERFPTAFDGSYYRLGRVRITVERLREQTKRPEPSQGRRPA